MGLSYYFNFKAPAKAKPRDLLQFLRTVEASAKKMGFQPTMVLDALFDTPERKQFARRLGMGYPVEDERLKGISLPAEGMVWHHDPQHGIAHVIPARGIVLVVTDEQR